MKKSRFSKSFALTLSLIAILAVTVSGTLAWLASSSGVVTNKFSLAKTEITIVEEFDEVTKKNVKVSNEGDVDVYIRATLVATWKDEGGNIIAQPDNTKINIEEPKGTNDWFKIGDVYYYSKPVGAKSATTNLIDIATVTVPEGVSYKFDLEVMAQSIQANPKEAVEEAWTSVTVNADGNLQAKPN